MKRFVFVPILLFAVAWFALPPAPEATSQPIPVAKHIVKSLPAQTKDELKIDGAGVRDVERVVMVPKVVVIKTVQSFPFTVTAPPGAGLYFWTYPPLLPVVDRNDSLEITSAPQGDLSISVKAIYVDLDKDGRFIGFKTKFYSAKVMIGEVPPGPLPPDPKPPDPKPPVPPGPVTGLRVLFITETADESKYPGGKIAAMYSAKVKEYLDAKCKGGATGWRRFDKDQDVSKLPEPWPKIWEAIKPQIGTLPQVAIITDQSGEIFPVPASVDEMLALLKKYGD